MIRNTKPSPLRIARLSVGLRQTDLATVVSRSIMYISRLERNGSAVLTAEIAVKLAAAVGAPAVLLFQRRPR